MSGTKAGGAKVAETNKSKYGSDYYQRIGAMGGKKKVPKGFAINRELARTAGAAGGRVTKKDYKRK